MGKDGLSNGREQERGKRQVYVELCDESDGVGGQVTGGECKVDEEKEKEREKGKRRRVEMRNKK